MRINIVQALGLLSACIATDARAQDGGVITNPSWARQPSDDEIVAVYPGFAGAVGMSGEVSLDCISNGDGTLSRCQVVEVFPEGVGFDRAGLSLIPSFRVNPRQLNGENQKSSVTFRIRFNLEDPLPSTPWSEDEPTREHVAAAREYLDLAGDDDALGIDLDLRGLDLDRQGRVLSMYEQVYRQFSSDIRDAHALAIARLTTTEELADLRNGAVITSKSSEDRIARAFDSANNLIRQFETKLRTMYCAEYACEER